MKKIITTVCFVSALIATQVFHAQTVDEIIDQHIESMGGKEKILSLKTLKITGTNLNPQGNNVDVVFTHKQMEGFRADRNRSGSIAYTIATPKKGWIKGFGETTPRVMEDNELKNIQNRLDIQGVLINYKEKETKVELAGKEKVENTDCYNLKVTDKNGIVNNYYIDSQTFRINKRSNGENSILYLNYKQNDGGFWFAYTLKQANGAVQTFTKIETNLVVDNKTFEGD